MKLSIGIVGLPNVGKSTLFKALTRQEVNVANYPFATIDPNVGVVGVPDVRLEKLSLMSKSAKKIPAVVEFYDIAGLVKGANKGEGLGNQFLNHIRETSVIVQVVRCFPSDDITHVEREIHPARDIDIINTELVLKDMETAARRLERLEREAKAGDKGKQRELEVVKKVQKSLNNGEFINMISEELLREPAVREMNLLTAKKQLYLLNGSEADATDELREKIWSLGSEYFIADLSENVPLDGLIRKAYEVLGLISFFTTGEKETRAWTVRDGARAPEAAGVIHSDFEEKFVRADVIHWEKLLDAGSYSAARSRGWIRSEGKEYVVGDGDVIEVRHG